MGVFAHFMTAMVVVILVAIIRAFANIVSRTDKIVTSIDQLCLTYWTVLFHSNLPQLTIENFVRRHEFKGNFRP